MSSSAKAEVTQEDIQKAQNRWASFTKLLKWGTIATIACVIFIALVTL